MKILGITLARGGSVSVPHKNIKPIMGIPLIGYTIREALKSRYLTRYIVSTDDPKIRDISRKFGVEAPFLRPKEYSTSEASSVSALQHAVKWIENEEKCRYDFIIEIMCTNPLKTVEDIDNCITKLVKTNADTVIAVHQLDDHHPSRIKKIVKDKIVDFCVPEIKESRRQDLKPKAYIRSGSIYAIKRDHLMIENSRYGSKNSRPHILKPENSINIDSENDFFLAEYLIKKKRLGQIKK